VAGGVISTINPRKSMNEITLPVSELKTALSGLSKVVSRKSTLPVLQTVKLSRNSEGRVSLSATDLDTFVTYNVEPSQPGQPLDVLLPFEQLNKTVKGSNGDVLVIPEAKDKARLRYQIGESPLEQSVATLAPEEFPPTPQITQPAMVMPSNFGETLRQAYETSSTDSSRYVLQGAYLDVQEPKCHTIVSTNGRALFAANTFQFDLKASVNIPRHKFLAWSGFLEGECTLAVQSDKNKAGWVKLTTPHWNCIVKQIDGQFPKWRQVVPQDTETWTKVQLSEAAIAQMLNLSPKLPGEDNENRTLQLRVGKELHLEGKNKDDKEFTGAAIAGVKISGKAVTTALNREYLQNALRCGLDEIRIHSEFEPLVFCRPGKRMVVMPVRLSGPPTTVPKPAPASQTSTPTKPPASNPAVVERKTEMPPKLQPPAANGSAARDSLTQIDSVKTCLRQAIDGLNDLTGLLKQVEKDKRTSEKEVASVRQTLRSLQDIKF